MNFQIIMFFYRLLTPDYRLPTRMRVIKTQSKQNLIFDGLYTLKYSNECSSIEGFVQRNERR
jgi:hypothetical protein